MTGFFLLKNPGWLQRKFFVFALLPKAWFDSKKFENRVCEVQPNNWHLETNFELLLMMKIEFVCGAISDFQV